MVWWKRRRIFKGTERRGREGKGLNKGYFFLGGVAGYARRGRRDVKKDSRACQTPEKAEAENLFWSQTAAEKIVAKQRLGKKR